MTYGDDLVASFFRKCDQLEAARADNRPSTLPQMAQRIFSAAALQRMTFPPLKFILPGLVPEGATLLVSRPKFGKSWLALDVAIATAADRFTLGTLKPSAGDVLYLALEDGRRRLQRRITKVLPTFSITWPKNLEIATEWPRADQGGLADIERWLVAHPNARLVVIDTLAQFRKLSNGKGQLYPEDYAAISGLQKLASKHNVGIIIVHHDRKSEADDVFDTVSGTLGLTGAADTILIMKRQAGAVTLYVRGRDIEESEMAMQFDKSSCRWSILGTAADVHRSNERTAVLKALETAGADGLSVAEIMAATGSQSRNTTDVLLFRMAETGEVSRVKRGVYARNLTDLTEPPSACKIGKKERSEEQSVENTIENSTSYNLTDLTPPCKIERKNGPTAPFNDPWEGLDIPEYLRRDRPRLGPPAISAGPDDDLGDLE
jgi:AAA domain